MSEAVTTVGDILRRHAGERPERTAMLSQGRETRYDAFDRSASRVANGLIAEGLKPQARVALLGKNSDSFYELLFGAAKANAVLVPVNWRLAAPEIAYVINDAGAELLLVGAEFAGLVESIRAQLPSVRRIIALDGSHAEWEGYETWRDRQPDTDPMLPAAPDDVVVQMYTSGTTGHPKGAQLTHHNFLSSLRGGVKAMRLGPDDVYQVVMPQFHIAGTLWGVFGLYNGGRIVIMREVDPGAILESIERDRVSKVFLVPAVILFLLQHPRCKDTDFSSLKEILYGASPIPMELLRSALRTFACGFGQVYGLTETTGAITYLPPEDHSPEGSERMKSCGRPYEEVEVRIVDPDGNPLPPGEIGEIVCRTALNMKGYWNLPEASAAAIRGDWFHTGDAGYMDEDGYVYIYDRVKDMIVSGGENVYPAEVESAIFGHPAVADVAVIGVPDPKWGEAVKAIVVRKPDAEVTADELIAHARERIAGYKLPKSVDFVEALPRNPSGKILKRELRKPYWQAQDRQVH